MSPTEFAIQLIKGSTEDRRALYESLPIPAVEIAEELQLLCYEAWTSDPQRVAVIAETLELLSDWSRNGEVKAYADWTSGIRSLVAGEVEAAVESIDRSHSRFEQMEKDRLAARTQTSKVYALALLGRYDEAVKCGEAALEIYVK